MQSQKELNCTFARLRGFFTHNTKCEGIMYILIEKMRIGVVLVLHKGKFLNKVYVTQILIQIEINSQSIFFNINIKRFFFSQFNNI